jgi:hypothetical protein
MPDNLVSSIRGLLSACSESQKREIFTELRSEMLIHEFENVIGAPAEMILEAVHRAPELTRRMLRGVIADAAFRQFVIPPLIAKGWSDSTPEGNFAYDYILSDAIGSVSIQVKLQRSEKGRPVVRSGKKYGLEGDVFIVETQKTRTGNDANQQKTRPYKYGEFDIIAVSMQPYTQLWDRYMFSLQRWLLPAQNEAELATLQPVSMVPDPFWTNNFETAVDWLRLEDNGKSLVKLTNKKSR